MAKYINLEKNLQRTFTIKNSCMVLKYIYREYFILATDPGFHFVCYKKLSDLVENFRNNFLKHTKNQDLSLKWNILGKCTLSYLRQKTTNFSNTSSKLAAYLRKSFVTLNSSTCVWEEREWSGLLYRTIRGKGDRCSFSFGIFLSASYFHLHMRFVVLWCNCYSQ